MHQTRYLQICAPPPREPPILETSERLGPQKDRSGVFACRMNRDTLLVSSEGTLDAESPQPASNLVARCRDGPCPGVHAKGPTERPQMIAMAWTRTEYGVGEHGFKERNSVSLSPSPSSRERESSVSSYCLCVKAN